MLASSIASRLAFALSFSACLAVAAAACGGDGVLAEAGDAGPTSSPRTDGGVSAKGDGSTPVDSSDAPDASADAATDAAPTALPITAPAGAWTFVPIAGMVCGDGSPTGISVNPSATPGAPLFVFLMGGGACWSDLTCLNNAADNVNQTVDGPAIAADIARLPLLFDRTRADGAFRDASFVFVPYCTGDLHAGNARRDYQFLTKKMTIEHRGARNVEAFLPRLAATFRAPKVVLAGASAGGFGALLNYHRFRAAFATARIDILDDSGTPIQPTGSFWPDMQSAWNLTLPASCTGCAASAPAVLAYLDAQMGPAGRLALLSYTQDQTIRSFTGNLVPALFEADLGTLRSGMAARQRMFYVSGTSHVLTNKSPPPTTQAGLDVATWLQQFASDDPAWAHQGP